MKKFLSLFFAIACATAVQAQVHVLTQQDLEAGVPCDQLEYLIAYQMEFCQDRSRPDERQQETMWLEIGAAGVSQFYSREVYEADSINLAKMQRGETDYFSGGRTLWRVVRSFPEKDHYAVLDCVGADRFVYLEDIALPQWEIVDRRQEVEDRSQECRNQETGDRNADISRTSHLAPSYLVPSHLAPRALPLGGDGGGSQTILGYPCQEAVAHFGGREWHAWFAEDIPLDEGPWKLKGLPGLILRVYSADGEYRFEATGMEHHTHGREILYKGTHYDRVSRPQMKRAIERYHYDPVGYLGANPTMRVTITDDQGNPITQPMRIPWNPIQKQ